MRYVSRFLKLFDRSGSPGFIQRIVYCCAILAGALFGGVLAGASGFGSQLLATPVKETSKLERLRFETGPAELPLALQLPGLRDNQLIQDNPRQARSAEPEKPRVVVVIDDMGFDSVALERLNTFPGPLTLSFLPYASDVRTLSNQARAAGHEVILHLPMEAADVTMDPGPRALRASGSAEEINRNLVANLAAFDGYAGVNNHMGSRFTRNRSAMKLVLTELDRRGLYFLDSLTTGSSVAGEVASSLGIEILYRDVFLDADHGAEGQGNVKVRLRDLEAIALEKGFAIAIAHPYPTTIEALGPWLLSLEERGFELVTLDSLLDAPSEPAPVLATLR